MITKIYEITCDNCGNVEHPAAKSIRIVKVVLKDMGWAIKGKRHICPDCVNDYPKPIYELLYDPLSKMTLQRGRI